MAARVLGNSGWLMAERMLGLLVGLVVGVWVARYLGPEQWGRLQYAMAFLTFFVGMAPLGLDSLAPRDMALYPKKRGTLLVTAGLMRLASAFVFAALAVGAALWRHAPGDPARVLIAVLAVSTLFQINDTAEWYLNATYQSASAVKAKLPGIALGAVFRLSLILLGAPLLAFAAAESVTALAVMLGLAFTLWRHHRGLKGLHFDGKLAWRLLKEGWPLALSALAVTIYMKIDQVMLGSMIGAHEVGIYAAAVRLSELWFFVPVAVVTAGFPALLEARSQGAEAYRRRWQRLTELMVLLSLALVVPINLLAGPLVRLLYGVDYAASAGILRAHVWGGFFVAFGLVFGRWLTAEGRTGFYAWMTVAGAVLNVALNLVWIPSHGGLGAAWATVAAYALTGSVMTLVLPGSRFLFHLQWRALLAAPARIWQALTGRTRWTS